MADIQWRHAHVRDLLFLRALQMMGQLLQLTDDLSQGNFQMRNALALLVLHPVQLLLLALDHIPHWILVVRQVDGRRRVLGEVHHHVPLALGHGSALGLCGLLHFLCLTHELLNIVQETTMLVFLTVLELVGEPGHIALIPLNYLLVSVPSWLLRT